MERENNHFQEKKEEVKKVNKAFKKNWSWVGWLFGFLWIFGGLGWMLNDFFIKGMVYIIAGIVILPVIDKFTQDNFNFKVPILIKIILILAILVV